MTETATYTRVYSASSARQLVSGKGVQNEPLTRESLLSEFRNHADMSSEQSTALVSISDRIIDTMSRAFAKRDDDHEPTDEIWIVFIKGSAVSEDNIKVHSAAELARRCGFDDSYKFQHEYLVEHAIPREHVLHEVMLQTPIDRGIAGALVLRKVNSESTFRHREPIETVRSMGDRPCVGWFCTNIRRMSSFELDLDATVQ